MLPQTCPCFSCAFSFVELHSPYLNLRFMLLIISHVLPTIPIRCKLVFTCLHWNRIHEPYYYQFELWTFTMSVTVRISPNLKPPKYQTKVAIHYSFSVGPEGSPPASKVTFLVLGKSKWLHQKAQGTAWTAKLSTKPKLNLKSRQPRSWIGSPTVQKSTSRDRSERWGSGCRRRPPNLPQNLFHLPLSWNSDPSMSMA